MQLRAAELLQQVEFSVSLWCGFFLVVHAIFLGMFRLLYGRRQPLADAHVSVNRAVSLVHSLGVSALGWVLVLQPGTWEIGVEATEGELFLMRFAAGYFSYDVLFELAMPVLVWVLRRQAGSSSRKVQKRGLDFSMLAHHLAALATTMYTILSRWSGGEMSVCLWLGEISSPALNLMKLFRDLRMDDTIVAALNKAVFIITFYGGRLVIAPYMVYLTNASPATHWIIKIGGTTVWLLSGFWFFIVMKALGTTLGLRGSSSRGRR